MIRHKTLVRKDSSEFMSSEGWGVGGLIVVADTCCIKYGNLLIHQDLYQEMYELLYSTLPLKYEYKADTQSKLLQSTSWSSLNVDVKKTQNIFAQNWLTIVYFKKQWYLACAHDLNKISNNTAWQFGLTTLRKHDNGRPSYFLSYLTDTIRLVWAWPKWQE